jgi:copper chaperone CopZ
MTTIEILNLKCGGCANTIKKGLLSLDNIKEVSIDIEKSLITVDTENQEDLIIVKEKLQKMGYPQVGDENTLVHKAKSFVSCATGRLNN